MTALSICQAVIVGVGLGGVGYGLVGQYRRERRYLAPVDAPRCYVCDQPGNFRELAWKLRCCEECLRVVLIETAAVLDPFAGRPAHYVLCENCRTWWTAPGMDITHCWRCLDAGPRSPYLIGPCRDWGPGDVGHPLATFNPDEVFH